MKSCPQCGAPVADDARFCTQCGYSFQGQPAQPQAAYRLPETKQRGSIWAVLGPVLAILIIGIGLLLVPRSFWEKKPKVETETEITVRQEALQMLNEAFETGKAKLEAEMAKGEDADPEKIKELQLALEEVREKIKENQ
ncbi:MAG: zinc ribbon domain-containing protein [Bacteroidales bacterium]|nr:zinc ribbon domain-containing protein [Bacteroidales bacterium]